MTMTWLCLLLLASTQDENVDVLIAQLGAKEIETRDRAQAELVRLGRKALPALEKASIHDDVEIRTRVAAAIKQILHTERMEQLKPHLSPQFLKEVPDVLRDATSDSGETWMNLLQRILGWRLVERDGELSLEAGHRSIMQATRRDVVALAECYLSGPMRDEKVEVLLCRIADDAGLTLPKGIQALRSKHSRGIITGCDATTPQTEKSPLEVLSATTDLRWASIASTALGSDAEKAADALEQLLSHPSSDVRHDALDRLGKRGFDQAVLRSLNHADPEIQIAAAQQVGYLGIEDAESALLALVKAAEGRVRIAAFRSLIRFAFPGSAEVFTQALTDESPDIRWLASVGLSRIREEGALQRLFQYLKDEDPVRRRDTIEQLGCLGDPAAAPKIRTLLQDRACRNAAARALGLIGDKESVPALLNLLDELDLFTYREAALALARLGVKPLLDWGPLFAGNLRNLPVGFTWELNRFASTEAWQKCRTVRLANRRYGGTLSEVIATWKKETEISFELDLPKDLADQPIRLWLPASPTLADGFSQLSYYLVDCVLLSSTSIRVLSQDKADAYWSAWLSDRLKK